MSMGHRLAVVRRGEVVQCGTPAEVYDHPVDLFVAQFLGSPPMNAVVATVFLHEDSVELRCAHQHVVLERETLARFDVTALHGHEVVLGLRPDAFVVDATGSLTVSPERAEQLGTHQLLHVTVPGVQVRADDAGLDRSTDRLASLVVSVPPDARLDVWAPLHLAVRAEAVHLFDAADGRSLERRAEPVGAHRAGSVTTPA
jgi:multiple sugar transport system ATP-binding protein